MFPKPNSIINVKKFICLLRLLFFLDFLGNTHSTLYINGEKRSGKEWKGRKGEKMIEKRRFYRKLSTWRN